MDEAQQSQMLGEFRHLFEESCSRRHLSLSQWLWSLMDEAEQAQVLEERFIQACERGYLKLAPVAVEFNE